MMSRITRYIISQMMPPFVLALLALTTFIWLTYALRYLDIVVINRQSLGVYGEILLYTLPGVIGMSLPFALLLACLRCFYRLMQDHEIPVMFSAGVSPLTLMRGPILVALLAVFAAGFLELYATPWGSRSLKTKLFQVRADIASSMLREGVFTNPARGITVFISGYDADGALRGILLQDARNPAAPVIYTAETGALRRAGENVELLMLSGTIQYLERTRPGGQLTFVSFGQYSYDISQLISGVGGASLRTRDLYPHELLAERKDGVYPAILHARLSAPLYCLAYVMIALAAFLSRGVSRRGYLWRAVLAGALCAFVRLAGYWLASQTARDPSFTPAIYSLPLTACMLAAVFAFFSGRSYTRRIISYRPARKRGGLLPDN